MAVQLNRVRESSTKATLVLALVTFVGAFLGGFFGPGLLKSPKVSAFTATCGTRGRASVWRDL